MPIISESSEDDESIKDTELMDRDIKKQITSRETYDDSNSVLLAFQEGTKEPGLRKYDTELDRVNSQKKQLFSSGITGSNQLLLIRDAEDGKDYQPQEEDPFEKESEQSVDTRKGKNETPSIDFLHN